MIGAVIGDLAAWTWNMIESVSTKDLCPSKQDFRGTDCYRLQCGQ